MFIPKWFLLILVLLLAGFAAYTAVSIFAYYMLSLGFANG